MEELEGQQIENYRLIRFLGSGDAGAVYLAEFTPTGNKLAIKLLNGFYDYELFFKRASSLTKLTHFGIIRVLDFRKILPPGSDYDVGNLFLIKDPHQRFASVQAFANALEQASRQ